MSFKVQSLSTSDGMRAPFVPLAPADYLLKVVATEQNDKDEAQGVKVGTTFMFESVVENVQNLPEGIEKGEVVGKTFKDFIFIMGPNHPKYSDVTKYGSPIAMIAVDTLKSFLDAVRVPIKDDAFNEKLAVGRYFEATISLDSYKDRNGKDRDTNRVDAYRLAEDVGTTAVEADAVIPEDFDDEDII